MPRHKAGLVLFLCSSAFGQSSVGSFELASIKRSSAESGSYLRYLPGGRLSAMSWIKQLVQLAYDVPDYQVTGGPGWLTTDRYEIEAKAADQQAGPAEMKLMLQSLLADRFKLKFRRESKEFPTYGLVVDKGGAKLTPLKPGENSNCRRENSNVCGMRTMAHLADWMTSIMGRPVLDQTKIEGTYDILLAFDVYELRGETPPPDYNKPNVFIGIREQLGLRLEAQKTSFPVIVIEDIQRPSEN